MSSEASPRATSWAFRKIGADDAVPFAPNLDYGSGIFRRRIRIEASGRSVAGLIEDTHHALRCMIEHDGEVVTRIEGSFPRAPTSVCGGATALLGELVGMPLATAQATLAADVRRHCLHLLDLALLLVSAAADDASRRHYDIVIPDETNGRTTATIRLNGEVVHEWLLSGNEIVAGPHAGRSLFGGFTQWAAGQFEGVTREAALMLQKGCLVGMARRYRTDDPGGPKGVEGINQPGVCYAYAPERIAVARRQPQNVRDFSEGFETATLGGE